MTQLMLSGRNDITLESDIISLIITCIVEMQVHFFLRNISGKIITRPNERSKLADLTV